MNPPRKPSPTESPLLFEIDDGPLQETLTAWGGVLLVVQALRSLGVPARVRQHVRIKQRSRSPSFRKGPDALAGLGEVNRELVRELGRRCADQRIASVDQNATIIESHSGRRCAPRKGSAAISLTGDNENSRSIGRSILPC